MRRTKEMLPGADRAVQAEAGNGVPVADTVPYGCGCGPAGSRTPGIGVV